MSEGAWEKVDHVIAGLFVGADPALDAAHADSEAAGLPAIEVSASQGNLLMLLARMTGARRILEIGTLGGYSTIWLARALAPGGRLITLEAAKKHAAVARKNIERAGLADRVSIRVGPALETLPELAAEGPFDFIFIDADKPNNPNYFEWALKLARKGSVIVVDNVIRRMAEVGAVEGDTAAKDARRFLESVAHDARVSAVAVQTGGEKGHDGFALALVL